jgi:3-oxoacyl-[acyl-carrier-protein] synthase-3
MPAFGAGLTLCAHLVRWGSRVTPIGESDAALPPSARTALEIVNDIRARKAGARERSGAGLMAPRLVDAG